MTVASELRPGPRAESQELAAFASRQLAGYKCPKSIRFLDSLPRTASGKVQRGKVRKCRIAGLD